MGGQGNSRWFDFLYFHLDLYLYHHPWSTLFQYFLFPKLDGTDLYGNVLSKMVIGRTLEIMAETRNSSFVILTKSISPEEVQASTNAILSIVGIARLRQMLNNNSHKSKGMLGQHPFSSLLNDEPLIYSVGVSHNTCTDTSEKETFEELKMF